MDNMKNILILGGVVLGYFVIMIIAKNIYSGKLAKAMAEGNQEKTKKLLFSNVAILLLNHQTLALMRASFSVSEGKYKRASRYCDMIKIDKLAAEHKMTFYVVQMQIALATKNKEMADEIQKVLTDLYETEKKSEIKDVIDDNEIQIALMIEFDPAIVEKLDVRVKTCKNKDEKGLLLTNLAKAYHLNHQDEEARACLKRAKEYVVNELTLQLIDAALKDIHVLD